MSEEKLPEVRQVTPPREHMTGDGAYRVRDSGLQVRMPQPGNDAFPAPDFVLVGIRPPTGGVLLFASTELTYAELRREVDMQDPFDLVPTAGGLARLPKQDISVTAKMRSFTQIYADTYPEALRSLHEQWARTQPTAGNALPPGL